MQEKLAVAGLFEHAQRVHPGETPFKSYLCKNGIFENIFIKVGSELASNNLF
jgi:hypothetical protein